MNETVNSLIRAIESGDSVSIESSFNKALAEKIAPKIEDLRNEVSSNMFNSNRGDHDSQD